MSMTLSSQAYEAIKNDIVHCTLPPGLQVTQSQMIARYAFGIVPIREALQRLAQEDLLDAIPRSGYIIRPITLSDVHEIYELRLPLEITAARLCALRGSQEQLNTISREAAFTYDFSRPDRYIEYLKRNASFHISIARAGSNQRLVKSIARLMDDMTRVLLLGLGARDRGTELQQEHMQLAEALQQRDVQHAEALVSTQVSGSLRIILESLADPNSHPLLSRAHTEFIIS